MKHHKKGILLVNLGSPESTSVADVRKYLREFLMDERVLDMPYLQRKLILELFILPKRPARSAEAYEAIWWEEGSPLVVISKRVEEALRDKTGLPVELGMRYGQPSIEYGMETLLHKFPFLEEVLMIPLYPHYAMSSYETAVEKAKEVLKDKFPQIKMTIRPPFYNDEKYISALSESIRPYLEQPHDHILFSYHGIPERHLRKSDVTGNHCLRSAGCCETSSEAHATCYRHQVFSTTKEVVKLLGIEEDRYSISFQSRLGRDPWLKPFTDKVITEMPGKGIHKLLVVCPSFVSDCLETLEEIGMQAKDSFRLAGGEDLTLVPCLNDNESWINVLADWSHEFANWKADTVASEA